MLEKHVVIFGCGPGEFAKCEDRFLTSVFAKLPQLAPEFCLMQRTDMQKKETFIINSSSEFHSLTLPMDECVSPQDVSYYL